MFFFFVVLLFNFPSPVEGAKNLQDQNRNKFRDHKLRSQSALTLRANISWVIYSCAHILAFELWTGELRTWHRSFGIDQRENPNKLLAFAIMSVLISRRITHVSRAQLQKRFHDAEQRKSRFARHPIANLRHRDKHPPSIKIFVESLAQSGGEAGGEVIIRREKLIEPHDGCMQRWMMWRRAHKTKCRKTTLNDKQTVRSCLWVGVDRK